MLCFPNAKINIGLNIIERRPDNFHNLETVFYPIPLSDILEILEKDSFADAKAELVITGMEIAGNPEANLCIKAYKLLDKEFDLPPVKIVLHKIIPMGAGLGGGSSDGAFTLTLLNSLFELNLTTEQLINYASKLGSDCPFFINNKPAFGTEKGNRLKNIALNLADHYLVLVKPPVFVGTAEAYAGIVPHWPSGSAAEWVKSPMKHWKSHIINDFEKSVFEKHPEIKAIKSELYNHGAIYASMTGSGSAVYGIFDKEVLLKKNFENCFYWAGKL
jgi:4-diphosphocytidyl-2C-methyl-D-erythritol kinase